MSEHVEKLGEFVCFKGGSESPCGSGLKINEADGVGY